MEMVVNRLRRFFHHDKGQTLVEYVLIAVLIAVVVIIMLRMFGGNVNNTYSTVSSGIPHT